MEFDWDPAKREENRQKHGIDFADVVEPVFYDPLALSNENGFAEEEQRHKTIGHDYQGRLLVITYTWRCDTARIINARKASKPEKRKYQQDLDL